MTEANAESDEIMKKDFMVLKRHKLLMCPHSMHCLYVHLTPSRLSMVHPSQT
jgi:hypothetical protein